MKLRTVVWIGVVLGVIYGLYLYSSSSPFLVSSGTAKQLIQDKKIDVVLDVRTQAERSTLGYYPNSVHISGSELEEEFPKRYPNKDVRVLIYCNTGQRSRKAAQVLHGMGYTNVVNIAGPYTTLL